jgi:hypothetical protein
MEDRARLRVELNRQTRTIFTKPGWHGRADQISIGKVARTTVAMIKKTIATPSKIH